jgi:metal-responsive CopG/Arc/MetJ family transcriptional regulator
MNTRVVTTRLDEKLFELLDAGARAEDRTRSQYVRRLLKEAVTPRADSAERRRFRDPTKETTP